MPKRLVSFTVVCIFTLITLALGYLNLFWLDKSGFRLAVDEYVLGHPTQSATQSDVRSGVDKVNCNHMMDITVAPTKKQPTNPPKQDSIPWIFAITPTYKRLTQIVDMTSLCQTLMHVHNLVWIVIEDGYLQSDLMKDFLSRCRVKTVHLCARNITEWSSPGGRGVAQRNAGLTWIREHCHMFANCNGSFYFMDDDNKYDLRLFELIRSVKFIGIWPVAYAGFLRFEGPVCVNNAIVEWHTLFSPERSFPLDMAGFAANVKLLIDYPEALFGYEPHSRIQAEYGWQETKFLENFSANRNDSRVECRGSHTEALVWHIRTKISPALRNTSTIWKYDIRTR